MDYTGGGGGGGGEREHTYTLYISKYNHKKEGLREMGCGKGGAC